MTSQDTIRQSEPLQRERGTSRPVEPGITRRALLRAAPAVAIIAAAPTAVRAAKPASDSRLGELIDAHRLAYAEYGRAIEALDDAEQAFRKEEAPRVALSISANGERLSGYCELGPVSPKEIRERIIDTHKSLRALHCGRWVTTMVPDFVATVKREIDAAEQRSLTNLDASVAKLEADRAAFGLIELDAEVTRTCREERRAMAMLLVHRPANEAEPAAKAAYIAAHEDYIGESVMADEGVTPILLELLSGVAS